jgi:hypothetical protein
MMEPMSKQLYSLADDLEDQLRLATSKPVRRRLESALTDLRAAAQDAADDENAQAVDKAYERGRDAGLTTKGGR